MNYHDTHFHLDLVKDPEKMAEQIEKAGVYTIAVTNAPSVFFFTEKLAENKKFIRPALGLHPELAAERHYEFEQFIELVSRTRYIGEVGLDNSNKSIANYSTQKKIFEKIVQVCTEAGNKILTIHSRKAASDVLDILGGQFRGKVILHWYSDTLKQLDIAIERGYFFSINYSMLLSKNGKKIIDKIPINQILIESDGPFTTYGSQAFSPLMVDKILNALISHRFKGTDSNVAGDSIRNNFKTLLAE